tara:strand:- start:5908 stop:6684 length:777 start_codon:yes stop_codon:yes gene_type:complete
VANLKIVKNVKTLTVNWDEFFFDINKLPHDLREGYQLARDQVARHYLFPNFTCPWDSNYHEKQSQLGEKMVTKKIFRNRSTWLAEKADEELSRRKITIQRGISTCWGVISVGVLVGTYNCMSTANQSLLLSQSDILGPELDIVNRYRDSSVTNIRRILRENSYDLITKEGNPKASLGSCEPEFRSNVKKLYYSRVNTRAEFCVASIYHEAKSIANKVWRYGAEKKQATLDSWEHDLGHDFELVDYFLHQKKRKGRSQS